MGKLWILVVQTVRKKEWVTVFEHGAFRPKKMLRAISNNQKDFLGELPKKKLVSIQYCNDKRATGSLRKHFQFKTFYVECECQ